MFRVYVVFCFLVFGCQYRCNRLPGKTRLQNDLLCVEWDVKPYTHFTSNHLMAYWYQCVLLWDTNEEFKLFKGKRIHTNSVSSDTLFLSLTVWVDFRRTVARKKSCCQIHRRHRRAPTLPHCLTYVAKLLCLHLYLMCSHMIAVGWLYIIIMLMFTIIIIIIIIIVGTTTT